MIDENDREAFLELTYPPADYKLTYCIGTTYSLELPCLVQLALNSSGRKVGEYSSGFHKEFEFITEFAKKSCLFVQNCRVKALPEVPPNSLEIFKMLDGLVHEVPSPSRWGVFHPKVWFIRFDHIEEGEPIFKLMVMSRNLTTSNKWDISVSIAGKPGKKSSFNDEIIDFLGELCRSSSLNGKTVPKVMTAAMSDLKSVEFEYQSRSFREFDFSYKWAQKKKFDQIPYQKYEKVLVISPSLARKELEKLETLDNVTLVTGMDDLKELRDLPRLKKNTFVSGVNNFDLHAKMYFGLHSEGTDVFVGSANCTSAGWSGDNVEAMAKILSPYKAFQEFFQNFIGKKEDPHKWLRPLSHIDLDKLVDKDPNDPEYMLQNAQKDLGEGEFHIIYGERDTKLSYEGEWQLPPGFTGEVRILGVPEVSELHTVLNSGERIPKVLLRDQTSFIEVTLRAKGGHSISFYTVAVTNINREQRNRQILQQHLKDWDSFWNYLGVLLNFDPTKKIKRPAGQGNGSGKGKGKQIEAWILEEDYLEKLMLKAAQDPDAVQKIDKALKDLELNCKGQKVEEILRFKMIWKPFKQAFEEFKAHG